MILFKGQRDYISIYTHVLYKHTYWKIGEINENELSFIEIRPRTTFVIAYYTTACWALSERGRRNLLL